MVLLFLLLQEFWSNKLRIWLNASCYEIYFRRPSEIQATNILFLSVLLKCTHVKTSLCRNTREKFCPLFRSYSNQRQAVKIILKNKKFRIFLSWFLLIIQFLSKIEPLFTCTYRVGIWVKAIRWFYFINQQAHWLYAWKCLTISWLFYRWNHCWNQWHFFFSFLFLSSLTRAIAQKCRTFIPRGIKTDQTKSYANKEIMNTPHIKNLV